MHALEFNRMIRISTLIVAGLVLAGCVQGKGDGPVPIAGTPATPLPDLPEGYCDPINFEILCAPPGIANFNGGVTMIIDNPDPSGINVSDKVAQMQKFPDDPALLFGGTKLELGADIDFSAGEAYKLKVWSPRSVGVTFKLEENGNPGGGRQSEIDHTGSSAWEEFCYDFTGTTAGLNSSALTLIFDNGVRGAADTNPSDWTFYYDHIEQVASCDSDSGGGIIGGTVPDVVLFASDQAADLVFGVDYTALDPFGSGSVFDSENTSDADFSPTFAVTTGNGYTDQVGQLGFVGFAAGFASTYATLDFKIKDINNDLIRVKFNDAGDYLDVTLTSSGFSTSIGNGWYQVSIPLTSFTGVDTATALLFETDNTAPAAFTFLMTDIGFSGTVDGGGVVAGDIAVNGGFETGDLSGWELFPGGGLQTITTDNPSSGTYAVNLTVPVRTQTDPAVDNLIKNANLQAGNLTAGDTVTVSFDMRGSLSGAGGVVFAELFSEQSGGGTSKAEILSGGPLTPTTAWTAYSFTTTLGPDVSGGVTLQLKTSCGPVEGCGVDVFIDNVTIVTGDGGTGGGGGGGGYTGIGFDDAGITYTLSGFNGAEGSFVTNDPAGAINMVAQVDRSATATASAGTTISTGANLSIPVLPLDAQNTQMTVRVYAPAAGIPVRLRIEDSTNSAVAVVTDALTTVGGAWETLTFNFLNEVSGTTPFDPAATYDKVTIFFNIGSDGATAGAQTFYFDDIDVLGGTGGGGVAQELIVNGNFETGDLTDWDAGTTSGGTISLVTPGSTGDFAVNVDASGGPNNTSLKQANLGAGQLTPGQEVTVSLDVKGSAAVGGVIDIVLFSESNGAGITQTDQILDGGAVTADWTTVGPMTFTIDPNDVSAGITLQVTAICGAQSTCVSSISLDNISIIAALSGSGGGGADAVLATFDEAVLPAVTLFGGAFATIEVGPAGGDGTNALNILRDGGQDFAGAWVAVPPIPGEPGTQTVSALVYSPTAGIPMPARIAVNSSVGTGDVQANETVVAGWQTLTWTFINLDIAEVYPRFVLLPNTGTIDTATSYFFDNITLVGGGGGGGVVIDPGTGSCGAVGELATNCDFELGDLTGWTESANGGFIEVVDTGASTGTYAAHLVAGPTQNPLIKQFEVAAGVVMPGDTVTISFDLRGSLSGDGGVVFAEIFSEGDPTTGEILTGGPIFPTFGWITHTFTPTTGVDVSRGITFQLAAVCGAVLGCGVDVYFDNVSIIIN